LKKRTPKQVILKVEYGSPEYVEAKKLGVFKGPYYDPTEQHVHTWINGVIPCAETPVNEHFVPDKFRKEFNGSYCKICHKVRHLFDSASGKERDVLNPGTKNLINAMKSFVIDESNKIDDYECVIPEPKERVIGFRSRSDTIDIRIVSKDEELFISSMLCRFIHEGVTKDGVILNELPNQKLDRYISVESDDGLEYSINSECVFPMCIEEENQGMVPVKTPPKRVHKRKSITVGFLQVKMPGKIVVYENGEVLLDKNGDPVIDKSGEVLLDKNGDPVIDKKVWFTDKKVGWDQRWKNYNKWRGLQVYLKNYLPDQCQYFQTFDPSDLYDREVQMNLKTTYDWSSKNYEHPRSNWGRFRGNKRPSFFMPAEFVPDTYFRFVKDDDNIERAFKKLRL